MGKCIFCDSSGLTREHIWADWLKAYVPRDIVNHNRFKAVIHKDRTDTSSKHQSGDPRSRKVKCVCGPCNNVWMSGIQTAAKPFLSLMAMGHHVTLDAEDLRTLASWATMFVMVADRDDSGKVSAVSSQDRDFFYRTRQPPPHWRIWVGKVGGSPKPLFYRYYLSIVEKEVPEATPGDPALPYNTQTVTFVVGKAFFHVMATSPDNAAIFRRWTWPDVLRRNSLVEIAPAADVARLNWPPARNVTDFDADFIAKSYLDFTMSLEAT